MPLATESELLNIFTGLVLTHGLEIHINHPSISFTDAIVALDVEHDEQGAFVGCGIMPINGFRVYYFSNLSLLASLDFQSVSIIAHNGKGDFECLRQWGINVRDEQLVWDSELYAHIIDSSRKGYGLKKLAKEDLGIEYPAYEDLVGKRTAEVRRTLDQWPIDIVSKYNALDCFVTAKLWQKQQKQMTAVGGMTQYYREEAYFQQVEKPASYVFQSMENRGIRVDLGYLQSLKGELEAQQGPVKESILNELGSINLNSPKQLLEALHAKEIFPQLKGKPSTDKRALGILQTSPIISNLLRYSELDTLLASFVYPYLERNTEIVHPFFNQCGTRTGRPSCSNPNLLQIPRRTPNGKRVRRMFIPRAGMVMGDCDFGQIESRVLANLSKDPALCQLFNDGTDFHTFTDERLGISRDKAKVLNLSVGYRATFKSVQAQLGGTREEAQKQIDLWWGLFPQLRRWQDKLIYESIRSGFCTTLLGRRIKVDNLSDGNSWRREAAERQLINNITQGSAAEIMKMAMIRLSKDDRLSESFGLLVQVYDELLFESANMAEDMKWVREAMENAVELDVPLTVDSGVGPNWAEAKA